MTEPVITIGTYADLRFVRSRKVLQVVIEMPMEAAPEFVRLFGAPDPAAEAWVTLARLSDKPVKQPEVKNRRPWNTLTPTEQAGIRSNDPVFEQYIHEVLPEYKGTPADFIRSRCVVLSRSELSTNAQARALWERLDRQFCDWIDEARIVG